MKTNTKSPILLYKRIIAYSLLGVLAGIFLWPQVASLSSISERKIIDLTNGERKAAGIGALTPDHLLNEAAREKGHAILNSGIFSHAVGERKFSHWIKDAGYEYVYAGENLAVDFVTGEGVLRAWMRSDTHKKNILNPEFSETGVAVLDGFLDGKNTTLVVQIFGSPRPAANNALTALSAPEAPPATRSGLPEDDKPGFLLCFDYEDAKEDNGLPAYAGGITADNDRHDRHIIGLSSEKSIKNAPPPAPAKSYPVLPLFGAIAMVAGLRRAGNTFGHIDLSIARKNKQLRLGL